MKLRTGVPYWRVIAPDAPRYPTASGDLSCEVAVVGGGITGALLCHLFVRHGIDTLLLDKRQPGEGSTVASTGLLQYEVDTHLSELIRKVGRDRAVHAYRRGLRAIDELEELTDELGDSCGFSRRKSLYFATHWWHARRLKREFECRLEHSFDVQFLSRRELREITSIDAATALYSAGDGEIDPYRLTQLLLARAVASGLRVYADSKVISTEESDSQAILKTERSRITARAAVFATGYEAHEQLKSPPGNLQSTYAVASEPLNGIQGWPERCLIWETARPYFYARQTEDGRAIIGGADTAFASDHTRDELIERKVGKLARRFQQLFPATEFVPSCAWAGTFAETKDGLAYIGKPPNRANTYFALGYGGNGITFGVIAARLIVDLYLGRPNADAPVFSFER
jgi:glycine/D-amino acid oxidase-like deaminating enzyme